MTSTAARVPQEERSRAMRQRLLEATVDCLVEHGWSGTSTTLVSQRAGVSRGAQLHHYPTKNDLVLAAIDHLATQPRGRDARGRGDAARRAGPHPPGPRDAGRPVHRRRCSSPRPSSGWPRAPTTQLRAAVGPLEARVGRGAHRHTVEALGVDESGPGSASSCRRPSTWSAGLGLANTLTDDADDAGPASSTGGPTSSTPTSPGAQEADVTDARLRGARRPRRGGRRLDGLVAALDEAGLADPHARRRGGTSPPRSPTSLDRRGLVLLAATDKAGWDAVVMEALADPRACRHSGAGPAAPYPRPSSSPAGAPRAGSPAALRGARPGDEAAVVRPADEPDVDGDRALHGDLGARARRRRGARRRRFAAARPGPPRRATSASAPALLVRQQRAPAPTEEVRVELTAPSGELWTYGDPGAAQRVAGPAWDFALLVTQRRHRERPRPGAAGAPRPTAGSTSPRRSPAHRRRPDPRAVRERLLRSATAPASTATAFARCGRCSRAAELDVLTGDYLAELTMLILGRTGGRTRPAATRRRSWRR